MRNLLFVVALVLSAAPARAQNLWELRDDNNHIAITIDSATHNVGGTLGTVTGNSSFTASGFFGDGANVTAVKPSNLASGSLPANVTGTTGTITSGQFGDSRVAVSTGATSGKFGDDKVSISTGAVASGQFGDQRVAISTQALSGGSYNGASQLVQLTSGGLLPTLNGSNLTNIASVESNTFSGSSKTLTGSLSVASTSSFGGVTLTTLTVTGGGGSTITYGENVATLTVTNAAGITDKGQLTVAGSSVTILGNNGLLVFDQGNPTLTYELKVGTSQASSFLQNQAGTEQGGAVVSGRGAGTVPDFVVTDAGGSPTFVLACGNQGGAACRNWGWTGAFSVNGDMQFGESSSAYVSSDTNKHPVMYFKDGGNVGIGSTLPTNTLTVGGQMNVLGAITGATTFTSSMTLTSASGLILPTLASEVLVSTNSDYVLASGGMYLVGGNTAQGPLYLANHSGDSPMLTFGCSANGTGGSAACRPMSLGINQNFSGGEAFMGFGSSAGDSSGTWKPANTVLDIRNSGTVGINTVAALANLDIRTNVPITGGPSQNNTGLYTDERVKIGTFSSSNNYGGLPQFSGTFPAISIGQQDETATWQRGILAASNGSNSMVLLTNKANNGAVTVAQYSFVNRSGLLLSPLDYYEPAGNTMGDFTWYEYRNGVDTQVTAIQSAQGSGDGTNSTPTRIFSITSSSGSRGSLDNYVTQNEWGNLEVGGTGFHNNGMLEVRMPNDPFKGAPYAVYIASQNGTAMLSIDKKGTVSVSSGVVFSDGVTQFNASRWANQSNTIYYTSPGNAQSGVIIGSVSVPAGVSSLNTAVGAGSGPSLAIIQQGGSVGYAGLAIANEGTGQSLNILSMQRATVSGNPSKGYIQLGISSGTLKNPADWYPTGAGQTLDHTLYWSVYRNNGWQQPVAIQAVTGVGDGTNSLPMRLNLQTSSSNTLSGLNNNMLYDERGNLEIGGTLNPDDNGIVEIRRPTGANVAFQGAKYSLYISSENNTEAYGIDKRGHEITGGDSPSVSVCGTGSPSVNGNDHNGTITVGGGVVTACTLTFANPYFSSNVDCVASDNSAAVTTSITSVSASAVTFGTSATIGGGIIYYQCVGR